MKDYGRKNIILILLSASAAVILISFLSYFTGDFSLEVLYALVILLASWYGGRLPGILVTAVAGAGITLAYHYFSTRKEAVHYANMVLEVVVLLTISLLTSALRKHHLQAELMAAYDSLTGVNNRNSFFFWQTR